MAGKDDSVVVRHNMVYEKVRMALNDVDVLGNDRKYVKKYAWLKDFVEKCDLNNKIIPFKSVNNTYVEYRLVRSLC